MKKEKKNNKINHIITKIKNNKRTTLYIIIAIIILIVIIMACVNLNKENIKIKDVLGLVNYKEIKVKKSKKTIYSEYKLDNYKIFETRSKVETQNMLGKVLFIRSKEFNANVFQSKIKILKNKKGLENPTMQVLDNMENLRSELYSYLGVYGQIDPINESLTGETKYSFQLPENESIYTEKRKYNSTYMGTDGNKYDINFYMDGDYLVCELVRFIDLDKKEKK